MRGANTGVFFFVVVEVFYVDWKCDTDRGSFVAVDRGVYEGDAISDHHSTVGWKERGELIELEFGRRFCVVSRGFVSIEVLYRRVPPFMQRIESAAHWFWCLGWNGLILTPQGLVSPRSPRARTLKWPNAICICTTLSFAPIKKSSDTQRHLLMISLLFEVQDLVTLFAYSLIEERWCTIHIWRGGKRCGTENGGLLHSGYILAQRSVGSKCRFSHKSIYVRSIVSVHT